MKVTFVEPPIAGHKNRGTGVYLTNLFSALEKNGVDLELVDTKHIPKDSDIVHFPYFDPFFLTLPFSIPKNSVITIHDLTPLVFPESFPKGIKGEIKWQINKIIAKKSRAIITDSKSSQKDITKYLGIPEERVCPIYLAPGNEFRKISEKKILVPLREKYSLPEKFILYVGDLNPNKNILGLIEGFYSATKKHSDVSLVIVGNAFENNDSAPYQEMLEFIDKLSLGDKINILGFVPSEDLIGIYNLSYLYIQPSLYEGFGLPVLEAMKCGVPAVVADVSSLAEIAGEAAEMVDPKDPENIAEGINKILNMDGKKYNLLAKKSFNHAEKFSWEKTAEETIEVYKQILHRV
ncbi:MAG: Glycosyltransferase [Candidatus Gottesmanbacteria bacterium GW2011_GWC2_39_8]|uniref:Glycosyltransferase n=1 Tax=Candidatus Gottesmanbacteria bacterium GW2011_GWC2_39_8 TaxID=1618450 RepID=A0A0G0Q2F2_9BACT|nr:MAG: Glycosyltransferase [Candidatus Gottesmanbacteria bacterium GW2011_GWC2_39_8]